MSSLFPKKVHQILNGIAWSFERIKLLIIINPHIVLQSFNQFIQWWQLTIYIRHITLHQNHPIVQKGENLLQSLL